MLATVQEPVRCRFAYEDGDWTPLGRFTAAEVGQRYLVLAPASEVCLHMRISDLLVEAEPLGDADGVVRMVQLYHPVTLRPIGYPVTTGEAGFFHLHERSSLFCYTQARPASIYWDESVPTSYAECYHFPARTDRPELGLEQLRAAFPFEKINMSREYGLGYWKQRQQVTGGKLYEVWVAQPKEGRWHSCLDGFPSLTSARRTCRVLGEEFGVQRTMLGISGADVQRPLPE